MATVIFSQPQNMFWPPSIYYGTIVSYSSSHISLTDGVHSGTYYGSFIYSAYDLAGGTMTGFQTYTNGVLEYSVSGASANALTVKSLLDAGNPVPVHQYVLQYADAMYGTNSADGMRGWGGNDLMFSGAGDDTLDGGSGNDLVEGGVGNDSMLGDVGNDTLMGGEGDDTLIGGFGQDSVFGDMGNDTITGSGAYSILRGGFGDDVISASGGNCVLQGGAGFDRITALSDGDYVLRGGLETDTLLGAGGSDMIYGGQGGDSIVGGAGNDLVAGLKGSDTVWGGAGDDTFYFNGLGGDIGAGWADTTDIAAGDRLAFAAGTLNFLKIGGSSLAALNANAALAGAIDANNSIAFDAVANKVMFDVNFDGAFNPADDFQVLVTDAANYATYIAAGDYVLFA